MQLTLLIHSEVKSEKYSIYQQGCCFILAVDTALKTGLAPFQPMFLQSRATADDN